jgi:putative hemin transport protein
MSSIRSDQQIRADFESARQKGLRAKEAAEHIGLTEGAALAAYAAKQTPLLKAMPVKSPLTVYPLKPRWLDILQSLEVCGPVMALTRNESTVHEKTGLYEKVSGNESSGTALGRDVDLRLFLDRWACGLLVVEPGGSSDTHVKSSLQFFDQRGVAVHKVFPVTGTDRNAWNQMAGAWVDTGQTLTFDLTPAASAQRGQGASAVESIQRHFTRRVPASSLRHALYQASFSGLPVTISVGNPGCIQIHSGPVNQIEPLNIHGKPWLNVLDPGFNLHLREDLIEGCWIVEASDGASTVSLLEVLDAQGERMVSLSAQCKPGQPEPEGWKALLSEMSALETHHVTES